jgi:hypothetical protein
MAAWGSTLIAIECPLSGQTGKQMLKASFSAFDPSRQIFCRGCKWRRQSSSPPACLAKTRGKSKTSRHFGRFREDYDATDEKSEK